MSATDLSYFKFRIKINFFPIFRSLSLDGIGKMVIECEFIVTSFWGLLIWILPQAPNFEYPPLIGLALMLISKNEIYFNSESILKFTLLC